MTPTISLLPNKMSGELKWDRESTRRDLQLRVAKRSRGTREDQRRGGWEEQGS